MAWGVFVHGGGQPRAPVFGGASGYPVIIDGDDRDPVFSVDLDWIGSIDLRSHAGRYGGGERRWSRWTVYGRTVGRQQNTLYGKKRSCPQRRGPQTVWDADGGELR